MTDTALLPCPLCGESNGYNLDEGSTYRWWSVKCAACGQEVSEARASYPAETTPRTANTDAAWNDAGKHAQALRDTIAQQAAELEALRRGEFICGKCGLRKDADAAGPVPF